jgi:hypothetical protein
MRPRLTSHAFFHIVSSLDRYERVKKTDISGGGIAMKWPLQAAVIVLALAWVFPVQSQTKIYTWTDAQGRVHLTDEPPPPQAKLREVVETQPLTPAEALQDQQRRQQRTQTRQDEERRSELEEITRRAREADEQARTAVRRAEEQAQRALETRQRFGNSPSRREQFKYRIREEDEKASQLQAEAQRAIDRARALSEEARTATAQAQPPRP